ncbi:integrase core domain-containing protein [Shimia sp. FJ5]
MLKYECYYFRAIESGSKARAGISQWMAIYYSKRPHSTHGIL